MANRCFTQWMWSLEKNPVCLWTRVTIGASGAPTLDGINSKGVASIVRNSAGNYTVTFGTNQSTNTYNNIFFANKEFFVASGNPAAPHMYVVSQTVRTNGQLVLQFLAANGTAATDPGNGEVIRLQFDMKISTAK